MAGRTQRPGRRRRRSNRASPGSASIRRGRWADWSEWALGRKNLFDLGDARVLEASAGDFGFETHVQGFFPSETMLVPMVAVCRGVCKQPFLPPLPRPPNFWYQQKAFKTYVHTKSTTINSDKTPRKHQKTHQESTKKAPKQHQESTKHYH